MAESKSQKELMKIVTWHAVSFIPPALYVHPKKPPFALRLLHYCFVVVVIVAGFFMLVELSAMRWSEAKLLNRVLLLDYNMHCVTNLVIVSFTFWNSDKITSAIVDLRQVLGDLSDVRGLKVFRLFVSACLSSTVISFFMMLYSFVNYDLRRETKPRVWYFKDGYICAAIFYLYGAYFVMMVQLVTSLQAALCVVISLSMRSLDNLVSDMESGKATRRQCIFKYINIHGRLCKVITKMDDSNYVLRGYLTGNSIFVQTLAIRCATIEDNITSILTASLLVAVGCNAILLYIFATAEMNHRVTNSLKVLRKLAESKASEDMIAAKEGIRHNQLETERKELRSAISLYRQHVAMTNPAITILKLCNFSYSTLLMMASIMATYSIMLYGIPEDASA